MSLTAKHVLSPTIVAGYQANVQLSPSVFLCTKLNPWTHTNPSATGKSMVIHTAGVLQSGVTFKCSHCGLTADSA